METSGTRRSYDTAQRRLQSAASRQRIVDEARKLFLVQGYRTTTIADIASAAGVNPDTVYRLVGRKPMVLRELIEQALSGTDHAVAGADRSYVRAMATEPDPVVKLEIYAAAVREIHGRLAPLFVALRDASSTEPEAERVWKEIGERRAANMRKLVPRRSLSKERPVRDLDQRGRRHGVGTEQCRALRDADRRARLDTAAIRTLAREKSPSGCARLSLIRGVRRPVPSVPSSIPAALADQLGSPCRREGSCRC